MVIRPHQTCCHHNLPILEFDFSIHPVCSGANLGITFNSSLSLVPPGTLAPLHKSCCFNFQNASRIHPPHPNLHCSSWVPATLTSHLGIFQQPPPWFPCTILILSASPTVCIQHRRQRDAVKISPRNSQSSSPDPAVQRVASPPLRPHAPFLPSLWNILPCTVLMSSSLISSKSSL